MRGTSKGTPAHGAGPEASPKKDPTNGRQELFLARGPRLERPPLCQPPKKVQKLRRGWATQISSAARRLARRRTAHPRRSERARPGRHCRGSPSDRERWRPGFAAASDGFAGSGSGRRAAATRRRERPAWGELANRRGARGGPATAPRTTSARALARPVLQRREVRPQRRTGSDSAVDCRRSRVAVVSAPAWTRRGAGSGGWRFC